MKKFLGVLGLLLILALPVASYGWTGPEQPVVADAWGVNGAHTQVNFSVTHFFTPVTGGFKDFEVDLNYDADYPADSSVEVRIAVASVDTGNEGRDNHLRTADWFAADEYPYITFKSESVTKSGDTLVARGPLTIRGQVHEVELPITLLGVRQIPAEMREMVGGAREIASFKASLTIDRGDYGVGTGSWAATMVVGGDVTIGILVEAHRK